MEGPARWYSVLWRCARAMMVSVRTACGASSRAQHTSTSAKKRCSPGSGCGACERMRKEQGLQPPRLCSEPRCESRTDCDTTRCEVVRSVPACARGRRPLVRARLALGARAAPRRSLRLQGLHQRGAAFNADAAPSIREASVRARESGGTDGRRRRARGRRAGRRAAGLGCGAINGCCGGGSGLQQPGSA